MAEEYKDLDDTFTLIKYKIMREEKLSQVDVSNIISGAIEGGSNYWLTKINFPDDYVRPKGYLLSDAIVLCMMDGNTLEFVDDEGKSWEFNMKAFQDAIDWYYSRPNALDVDYMDADDYDMIIQYSVFKEVIYG